MITDKAPIIVHSNESDIIVDVTKANMGGSFSC